MAKKIKVAIDAGHGSQTAGKRTPDGYREHWINVRCANYCEQALKRCGFDTIRVAWDDTISTDDIDVSLYDRQAQIKNAGCDSSVSFHANASGSGAEWNSGNGVETLIHNNSYYVKDSRALATKVQSRLMEGTKQSNRGVKTQELAMCNCIACGTNASVLVEIGFMTNKVEAELMKTESFCKEQAEEVAHGICDYYGVAYKTQSSTTSTSSTTQKTSSSYKSTSKQKINSISGTLKVIYKGADGLNVRTSPSVGNSKDNDNISQVVRGGTYTVVGISEDKNWYKLKSGLFITTNTKYVEFTKSKKTSYMVRVTIPDLNIRKTPSAKDNSNKWNKYTGKNSFTIVEEATGPINSSGKTGKWGLLKSYQEDRDGWICLDIEGVEKVK